MSLVSIQAGRHEDRYHEDRYHEDRYHEDRCHEDRYRELITNLRFCSAVPDWMKGLMIIIEGSGETLSQAAPLKNRVQLLLRGAEVTEADGEKKTVREIMESILAEVALVRETEKVIREPEIISLLMNRDLTLLEAETEGAFVVDKGECELIEAYWNMVAQSENGGKIHLKVKEISSNLIYSYVKKIPHFMGMKLNHYSESEMGEVRRRVKSFFPEMLRGFNDVCDEYFRLFLSRGSSQDRLAARYAVLQLRLVGPPILNLRVCSNLMAMQAEIQRHDPSTAYSMERYIPDFTHFQKAVARVIGVRVIGGRVEIKLPVCKDVEGVRAFIKSQAESATARYEAVISRK